MSSNQKNIFQRIKNSIYSGSINPKTDSGRLRLIYTSLILHLHPPTIDKKALTFKRTFGLGGMAIVLICLLFFTGLLLRFVYEPFPGRAYESILHLQNNVLFGQLIRNIHHWSGILLIVITLLHLLRVFFTGAFHGKRQFNWVIGIALILLVVFSNFTGYLLPWDQLSYWAVTVGTSMMEYIPLIGNALTEMVRGGHEVGASTLLLFYTLHTGIFPLLIILLMAFHFWRVRKAGGVVLPQSQEEKVFVPTIPNLVAREFVVALILIAVVFLLSTLFNAPLLDKANPDFSPNPAKAPWYFLGIQELMLHFHPLFAAVIIPGTLLTLMILFPYFIYDARETGEWFYSKKGKSLAIIAAINAAIVTILLIILDEYFLDFSVWLDFLPEIISNGLIPFLLLSLGLILFYKYLVKNRQANKNEAIQALFVFIFSSFIILTLTGIFFRGAGMVLTF
jgi:quinol-cytochrome oxidoreductase complex cytochrome b subunit